MSGTVPIALTVSACAALVCTEVVRSVVHRHRERVQGIGGTQDIAMWGTIIAWLLLIAAMVTGGIWLSHHSRANKRSALHARWAVCFHINAPWPGAPNFAPWVPNHNSSNHKS